MSVVTEIIRNEENGTISFGNYELASKTKVEDFSHDGNLYKVKTFKELTKLEKDGAFAYESEPGTCVQNFAVTADGATFTVSGNEDAMITVGLTEETEYDVCIAGKTSKIKSNLAGKLSFSVELAGEGEIEVKITK